MSGFLKKSTKLRIMHHASPHHHRTKHKTKDSIFKTFVDKGIYAIGAILY